MAYKYFNRNPNGYKIPDCVIRAISTALNINYYDVVKWPSILNKRISLQNLSAISSTVRLLP